MSYTCNGNGHCDQDRWDECEYHDVRVSAACHGAIGDLSKIAQGISDECIAGDVPTGDELKRADEFENAFWRGVEKRLEADSDRLQLLRRERNELLEACEGLIAVVGLAAFKHESQRAVLQDAVDIASTVCAKARNRGKVSLSGAIDRLRKQGDALLAAIEELEPVA